MNTWVCPWNVSVSRGPEGLVEYIDESVGDFVRLEGRVFAKPVTHPVERARQGERGHARIALTDGAVGDAGLDERAHAFVDPAFSSLMRRLIALPRC